MQQQGSKNGGGLLVPYIRQSRAKERTISLDDQRRAIEKWAEVNGVTLAKEIEEPGVSGNKSWRERKLGEAIAACERGEAAGIVVAFQDRLSRENGLATAEVYEALQKAQARLVCAAEGLDTASGDQEMLYTIKAAIAREQWKRHKLNWANGRRDAIERGVHVSTTPAGYTAPVVSHGRDGSPVHGPLVPNEHAPAVRAAFEARAKGTSWMQIAKLLTAAGVPTGADRQREEQARRDEVEFDGQRTAWSFKSAAFLCQNPVYLGQVKSGEFVNENAHEAIVDPALWRKVRARDQQPGQWSKTKRERALLQGVLRCAHCGGKMTRDSAIQANKRRQLVYRCRNFSVCDNRPTINLELVEDYVSAWVVDGMQIKILHPPKYGKKGTPQAALERALAEAEAELETFVTATSASGLGADLYARGLAQRARAVDEAQQALLEIEDDAEALKGLPDEILEGPRRTGTARNIWEAMPMAHRNRTLRRHFPTGIPVKRGRGLAQRIGSLDEYALQEEVVAA